MNFISFSVFGADPMYLTGMIRNAQLAKEVYPGWKVICWCDSGLPADFMQALAKLRVDVREPEPKIANQMFWRFLVADEPEMERFIVRDSDSRLGAREKAAVDEWIESDLPFHVMSDHPHHWMPIGGGLWGAKAGAVNRMKKRIIGSKMAYKRYTRSEGFNQDQMFLQKYIYPLVQGKILRHDSCNRHLYPWARPFPSGCCFGDNRFVGEAFDADDKPNPWHWQQRINWMTR